MGTNDLLTCISSGLLVNPVQGMPFVSLSHPVEHILLGEIALANPFQTVAQSVQELIQAQPQRQKRTIASAKRHARGTEATSGTIIGKFVERERGFNSADIPKYGNNRQAKPNRSFLR